ncbi:MAG: CHRD domain-containing protein [Candidatus Sumerlaeota bacterium]|nr:CHRD domain-containing protein [Candidatus Sumerlaeota bacterium]
MKGHAARPWAFRSILAVLACVIAATSTAAPLSVNIGTIPAGKTVTMTFDAAINSPLPWTVRQVSNQGTVSGTGFAPVHTDDPDTPAPGDPTVTEVIPTPLEIDVDPLSVDFGDRGIYDGPTTPTLVTVTNNGPTTLTVAKAVIGTIKTFPLDGAQEVPPNASLRSGRGLVILNQAQTDVAMAVIHDIENPTAAHVHRAPPGVSGPVVYPFPDPANPILADTPIAPTDVTDLLAGGLYVNVHTALFPGGEIRGQIDPTQEEPSAFSIFSDTGETVLGPGAERDVWVVFDPEAEGVTTDTLSIFSNDSGQPVVEVALRGRGVAPHVGFIPPSLVFGAQDIDDGPTAPQSIEVKNVGEATLSFTGVGFAIDGEFQIVNTPSTADLAPGDSVFVDVAFDPSVVGPALGALHVTTNDPSAPTADAPLSGMGAQFEGAPILQGHVDNGDGTLGLTWTNPNELPAAIYSLAYDLYEQSFVEFPTSNSLLLPSLPTETSATLPLAFTGGYFAWTGNLYANSDWFVCPNPFIGILYSGVPHTVLDVSVTDLGTSNTVRLSWRPDVYGSWLYEIIVFQGAVGFISVDGPSSGLGFDPWTFIDYGGLGYNAAKASFLGGWAEMALPGPGEYWVYIRNVGWLPPYPAGEWVLGHVMLP